MLNYILRRIAQLIPVLLVVAIIVFGSVRMMPGDPARLIAGVTASDEAVQAIRSSLGLNKPFLRQFAVWLGSVIQGDFGASFYYKSSAGREVLSRFPATLVLAVTSICFSSILGIGAGVWAAVKKGSVVDKSVMLVSLFGICVPTFWSGLMLILLFSVTLNWLPSGGSGTWRHLLLPSVTLGLFGMGLIARVTRSTMLEVLSADFIRTARAKSVNTWKIIWGHALKNALIPVITIVGLQFGGYLGRAVITETVFAWPGLGRLIIQAVQVRDFPIIQGAVLLMAVTFTVVNLLVDVAYSALDPRIRYS